MRQQLTEQEQPRRTKLLTLMMHVSADESPIPKTHHYGKARQGLRHSEKQHSWKIPERNSRHGSAWGMGRPCDDEPSSSRRKKSCPWRDARTHASYDAVWAMRADARNVPPRSYDSPDKAPASAHRSTRHGANSCPCLLQAGTGSAVSSWTGGKSLPLTLPVSAIQSREGSRNECFSFFRYNAFTR